MRDDLATHVESIDIGVVRYGAETHFINYDGVFTEFFCGLRGVRVRKRHASQKARCGNCVHVARSLAIKGV
jgi:hypothetical protein